MSKLKIEAMVSVSYFDFDFGDNVVAADVFAKAARATLIDRDRGVELHVKYRPIDEEDKEEEQDDQATD